MNLLDETGAPIAPETDAPAETAPVPRLVDPLTPLQAMTLLEGVESEEEARAILLWAGRTRQQARVLELALAGLAELSEDPDNAGVIQFRLLTQEQVRQKWEIPQTEGPDHG